MMRSNDEIGLLAKMFFSNIEKTHQSLEQDTKAITQSAQTAKEIESGNLTARITETPANPKLRELKDVLNKKMIATLALVFGCASFVYGNKAESLNQGEIEDLANKCFSGDEKYCSSYIKIIEQMGITSDTCDRDLTKLDSKSCVAIAHVYFMFLLNYDEAIKYYEKLDRQKLGVLSLFDFGWSYYKTNQCSKAYAIFNSACEAKIIVPKYMDGTEVISKLLLDYKMESCSMKASMMFDGEGTRQNQTEAVKIVKNICDSKEQFSNDTRIIACFNTGIDYGKLNNLSLSKAYFGKACDLGDDRACNEYKILNERGLKEPKESAAKGKK